MRWGKTLDCLTRYAFCSLLVSLVCLSLSLRVCTSRESESVVLGILLVSISVLESLLLSLCLFFSSS